MSQNDLTSTIANAAAKPSSGTVDGVTVTQRPLSELIAADKYMAAKNATKNKAHRGLRFGKIVPPGAG
jgi:hypothetical protein